MRSSLAACATSRIRKIRPDAPLSCPVFSALTLSIKPTGKLMLVSGRFQLAAKAPKQQRSPSSLCSKKASVEAEGRLCPRPTDSLARTQRRAALQILSGSLLCLSRPTTARTFQTPSTYSKGPMQSKFNPVSSRGGATNDKGRPFLISCCC